MEGRIEKRRESVRVEVVECESKIYIRFIGECQVLGFIGM